MVVLLAAVGFVVGSMIAAMLDRLYTGAPVRGPLAPCAHCGTAAPNRALLGTVGWLMLHGRCPSCGARLPNRLLYLPLDSATVVRLGTRAGLDPDSAYFFGVALREALTNAIRHGNGWDAARPVQVSVSVPSLVLRPQVAAGSGCDGGGHGSTVSGCWPGHAPTSVLVPVVSSRSRSTVAIGSPAGMHALESLKLFVPTSAFRYTFAVPSTMQGALGLPPPWQTPLLPTVTPVQSGVGQHSGQRVGSPM